MKRVVKAKKVDSTPFFMGRYIIQTESVVPDEFEISWEESGEISHLCVDEGIDMKMAFVKKVNELVTAVNELRGVEL